MSELEPSFGTRTGILSQYGNEFVKLPDGNYAETRTNRIVAPIFEKPVVELLDDGVMNVEPITPVVIESEQSDFAPEVTQPVVETVENTQTVEDQLSDSLKLVLNVDKSSDAAVMADRMAEARIQKELEAGGKFKHILGSLWKGGIVKDHYIRKYRVEAERFIRDNGGDLSDPNAPAKIRAQAKESQIWQFQTEIEEAIHTDAGEKKEILDSNHELAVGAKDLIKRYCAGEFHDDNSLAEARTRLLNDYKQSHPDEDIGRGVASVDNLLEIAKTVSGMTEHGESIDNILDNMQTIMGEARSGVRTEADYNKVDKFIDKLARTKVGSVAMPLAIISAVSIAVSVGRFGSKFATKKAALFSLGATGGFVFGAALAGGVAGLHENKRMKDDRSNQMRDRAEGKTFNENDKRRAELNNTVYEMVSANSIKEQLDTLTEEEKLINGGQDALKAALDALANIEARNKYSDLKKVDLISFSNPESVVAERLQLDISRANAKESVNRYLTAEMRSQLGLDGNIGQIIESQAIDILHIVQDDVTEKDKQFNKIKSRRVAKAIVTGVATSLTFGLLAQEIGAAIDPTRAGLLEQAWGGHNTPLNGVEHHTLLGGIFAANHATIHTGPNADFASESLGGGKDMLYVSSEHNIVNNGNGTFNLLDPTGHATAENIPINPNGSLPQSSIDQLHGLGMEVTDKSVDVSNLTTHTESVDVKQFVDHNIDHTTTVHRELWYDNNTPGKYDNNELGLWWGGQEGVTDNGYQFSISHMTEGGSVHDGQSVNWAEAAKEGNLKLAISGSTGTQNHVFMVDIDSNGNFNIDKDSPVAQFFSEQNGKAEFNGAFAEVVEIKGVDASGVTEMNPLATFVGHKDTGLLTIENITETFTKTPIYEIVTPGYDTVATDFVEMPPVIPVVPRQNMGSSEAHYEAGPDSVNEVAPITPEYSYYGGDEVLDEREIEERRIETSPRLRDNHNADLVPSEEFAFYENLLVEKRGQDYVNEIKEVVSKVPELSNINSETDTIVAIPVNAAGKSESENIYNVLTKGYGAQDLEGLKGTLILLHVNWFDSYDEDESAMRENIAKTKSEIQRAKDDLWHLGVNVAVIETEYKRAEVVGGVIGYVARKMNDVALLALNSAAASGRIDKDHDILLIRNDADVVGIRHHYLKRFKDEFKANKEPDVFMGMTSFDQTKADRAPGLVLSGNFMQSFSIIENSRGGRIHTGGANFGVRASTLAAVGGLGFGNRTGAGSDDVVVGQRIKSARGGEIILRNELNDSYSSDYQRDKIDLNDKKSRIVGKTVHGARIDTNSDRGEREYIGGKNGFVDQWSGGSFSKNGYTPRNAELSGKYIESLKKNPDEAIENIRRDFQATIRGMRTSAAMTRSVLGFTFPRSSYYELSGDIANCNFIITPEGVEYLKNRLISRDAKGRFAKSYGRQKREWYGENSARRSTMIKI